MGLKLGYSVLVRSVCIVYVPLDMFLDAVLKVKVSSVYKDKF